MGSVLALPVTVPVSGARTRLSDFLRRRKQLVEIRKAEKLHRHSAGQEEISTAIDAMIALLASQIADLGRSRHRPDSAGDPSRRTSRTRNPLPASHRLAGRACTPCPGKRNLARRTPHLGRETESPEALYIAALAASRRIPVLVAMRYRMRLKGKAPKNHSHRRRTPDPRHPQCDAALRHPDRSPMNNTVAPTSQKFVRLV